MGRVEIRIPQLGEGLQEARILRFLKQPGETVAQDEPIYEMETDKAVMEIESPVAGTIREWTAKEDDVLPIGATIGEIATEAAGASSGSTNGVQPTATEPTVSSIPEPDVTDEVSEPLVEIKIPQLGEGLQEARILRFLKQPGETVAQDEPIYEMETDKAVMEIESPVAGTIREWTAKEDDVLPIGATIGRIGSGKGSMPVPSRKATGEDTKEMPVSFAEGSTSLVSTEPLGEPDEETENAASVEPVSPPAVPEPRALLRNAHIPPRTRAHARARGLSDVELARLAQQSDGKLLPDAIDRYLKEGVGRWALGVGEAPKSAAASMIASNTANPKSKIQNPKFTDISLPSRQRTLVYRLQRSAQAVVPATMEMPLLWNGIETVRAQMKAREAEVGRRAPTQFLLFAWCVAQATQAHPRFRAALLNDTTLRQYNHLHLGIAVARPDDELLMARIPDADTLAFAEFVTAAQSAIDRAREGEDQTSDAMQLSLTNMAGAGLRFGIPIVVAPAVGTLFIGAAYDEAYPLPGGGIGFRRLANMVFTFDHRLANGIGAANFLTDIRTRVENIQDLISF